MEDLVTRLQKRAKIRREIQTRKSVQEGKPDRIADLLDEAAKELIAARERIAELERATQGHPTPCTLGPLCPYCEIKRLTRERDGLCSENCTVKIECERMAASTPASGLGRN